MSDINNNVNKELTYNQAAQPPKASNKATNNNPNTIANVANQTPNNNVNNLVNNNINNVTQDGVANTINPVDSVENTTINQANIFDLSDTNLTQTTPSSDDQTQNNAAIRSSLDTALNVSANTENAQAAHTRLLDFYEGEVKLEFDKLNIAEIATADETTNIDTTSPDQPIIAEIATADETTNNELNNDTTDDGALSQVTAVDALGHESVGSASQTLTIDTTSPDQLNIAEIATADETTNNELRGDTTDDVALSQVTVVDALGHESGGSASQTLTIDTTSLVQPIMAITNSEGESFTNGTTIDTTALTITASNITNGDTVNLYVNGTYVATSPIVTDASYAFNYINTTNVPNPFFHVEAVDPAGNTTQSQAYEDLSAHLLANPVINIIAHDDYNTVTISVHTQAGATVSLFYDNLETVASGTANDNGIYTYNYTYSDNTIPAITASVNSADITATTTTTTAVNITNSFNSTVDITDSEGNASNLLDGTATSLTISGTTAAYATVNLSVNGTAVDSVITANQAGDYSYNYLTAENETSILFNVRAVNLAGESSNIAVARTYYIDENNTVTGTDNNDFIRIADNVDDLIIDAQGGHDSIRGTAGGTIEGGTGDDSISLSNSIDDRGTLVYDQVDGAVVDLGTDAIYRFSTNDSIDLTGLLANSGVTLSNLANYVNVSVDSRFSNHIVIKVDTDGGFANDVTVADVDLEATIILKYYGNTIDTLSDLTAQLIIPFAINITDAAGNTIAEGSFINDNVLTISGNVAADATVNLYVNGNNTPVAMHPEITANNDGNYSFDYTASDGENQVFTVKAVDALGNESVGSTSQTFTIDTTPPDQPTMAITNSEGESFTNGTTIDTTALTITASNITNGDTVNLYVNGTYVATSPIVTDASYAFNYINTTNVPNPFFHVEAVDPAGNTTQSQAYEDLSAHLLANPVINIIAHDDYNTVTISVHTQAGATVSLFYDNLETVASGTANDNGIYTYNYTYSDNTIPAITASVNSADITATTTTTTAVNITNSFNSTVDITDSEGNASNLLDGTATSLTISGTTAAYATVNLSVNGTAVDSVITANQAGDYSYNYLTAENETSILFNVRAVNLAGESSNIAVARTYYIDENNTVTGTDNNDFIRIADNVDDLIIDAQGGHDSIRGTAGGTIEGGTGDDSISLSNSIDDRGTLVYDQVDGAVVDLGTDAIYRFSTNDSIDLTGLLANSGVTSDNLANYVNVSVDTTAGNNDTVIKVDTSGGFANGGTVAEHNLEATIILKYYGNTIDTLSDLTDQLIITDDGGG